MPTPMRRPRLVKEPKGNGPINWRKPVPSKPIALFFHPVHAVRINNEIDSFTRRHPSWRPKLGLDRFNTPVIHFSKPKQFEAQLEQRAKNEVQLHIWIPAGQPANDFSIVLRAMNKRPSLGERHAQLAGKEHVFERGGELVLRYSHEEKEASGAFAEAISDLLALAESFEDAHRPRSAQPK